MIIKKFSAHLFLCILLLGGGQAEARAADDQVTLNFVNSDIESTIKAVGVITGKNFVIDPKVKGTINIVSNQPVARSLIYPILLSAHTDRKFNRMRPSMARVLGLETRSAKEG